LKNLEAPLSSSVTLYGDGKELLEKSDIDAVIIATPASTHAGLIGEALAKGKHVLVEKPMVASKKEVAHLYEAVDKSGRTFMVGHQYVYHDYVRHLKAEIDQGRLGNVKYCFAEHLYFGPIRYDIGCLWETVTHELAIIDYLFGAPEIMDVRGRVIVFSDSNREDGVACELTFGNGLLVSLVTSWFAPKKVRRMTLGGDRGMAIFDDQEPEKKLQFFLEPYPQSVSGDQRTSLFLSMKPEHTVTPAIDACEPLRNELEHFIGCIQNKKTPLTDIEHGCRITEHLDMISSAVGIRQNV